ncbi:ABC transporter substrate-binding protein [Cohnella nanjingensis]|nr:ABC transporter substrate-binding protein [Cohnella nanjingensis]
MTLALVIVAAACGNSNNENASGGSASASSANAKEVKITFLNSKGADIQAKLEAAAATFKKANPNIAISIISTGDGQSPVEMASTLYASGTAPALIMLDAGDISKFQDKAADLSNEKWVADMAQPNQIAGKTLAFPFSIEGYGLIYNKAVVDKAVGGTFDPAAINTTSSLEELFNKIQATGVNPLLIGSMDWSLGNHFLALAYAAQPDGDVVNYLNGLKAGTEKIADNTAFQGLMNTFDVMKKYNAGKKDPLAVTYEKSAAAVAKGEAAMTFNGNWMYLELQKSNPTGEFGFIPVPVGNQAGDKANSAIAIGATKQVIVDKTQNSEAQQAAAKKFLEWIVYDAEGQDFLVNQVGVIPAFKNITLQPKDSLAVSIKAYNDAGKSIAFAGNYVPGDHWKVLGASMQKYLAGKSDVAELASDIQNYWKTAK